MSEEKKTGGSIRLHLKRGKDFSLDVEFELNQSGITVLFGPSGCGKLPCPCRNGCGRYSLPATSPGCSA